MSALFKSIRFKVPACTMALLVIVTLALYMTSERIMRYHLLSEVIKRAESISRNVAISAGYSFISRDILGLDNMVYSAKEMNKDIDYVAIVGNNMKTVVHSDINKKGEMFRPAEGSIYKKSPDGTIVREEAAKGKFEVISPVSFKKKRFGMVAVGINGSALVEAEEEAKKKMFAVFLVIAVLGPAEAFWFPLYSQGLSGNFLSALMP